MLRNLDHGEACPECTTNCLLVHRNPVDRSSSVDRFFKIMMGGNFSEVMFVPSSVARDKKWHKYTDREACLEDTNGVKYPVKISKVDNAFALKEGWGRFSSEHHLKEGDFLVFNHVRYVAKLHFIVHIFGKSGQEKVFFQRGHDKNVSTINRNAVLLNETLEPDIMSFDSKKSPSSSVVPKPLCSLIHHHSTTPNNTVGEYTDGKMLQLDHAPTDMEPLYMIHRDAEFIDDRTCLYDLSSFEKQDLLVAPKVSISNDESDTMNHAEKIIDSQTDSDVPTFSLKRKFSSPEPQPNKKQNAIVGNTIKSEPVNVPSEMKMDDVNGGSSTHVSKMIECRDRSAPVDNIPVQGDVPILKTPSFKAALDNRKNIDRSGPASLAQDIRQKVVTGSTIGNALVNVAPEMNMVDGERSSTLAPKRIECRDRTGPADKNSVQREVPLLKTPSYKEILNNKKTIDLSGPTSSAQDIRRQAATGDTIKTVKKELDVGNYLSHHQRCQSGKKKTISPENVRRSYLNVKKDVKIPKTEPFCSEEISTSFGGRESSTAVIDDKPYLILQTQLPSVLFPREKSRTIYLRAPDRKVFPVTYQQKNGIRVLASGWQLVKLSYHLHAGDWCRIELEDESKRIYSFEIISRVTFLNRK
ncbi:hypothetical protein Leryth_008566 [Lithospermum erythrorhizon]|nr:hypothetical protein Leryth_008566 [Lithospermum erythrorhizon]